MLACSVLIPFDVVQGLVSYPDFKRVFGGNDDEMESRGGGGQSNFEQIQPRLIPELVDLSKVSTSAE